MDDSLKKRVAEWENCEGTFNALEVAALAQDLLAENKRIELGWKHATILEKALTKKEASLKIATTTLDRLSDAKKEIERLEGELGISKQCASAEAQFADEFKADLKIAVETLGKYANEDNWCQGAKYDAEYARQGPPHKDAQDALARIKEGS